MSESARACPRCGARRFHRAHSRSSAERLLRAVTPIRAYHCHACGLRTWTFGRRHPVALVDQKELGLPARPLEERDGVRWSHRRRRLLAAALASAAVGAALARWLVLR